MKRRTAFATVLLWLLLACDALQTPLPITHLASTYAAYGVFPHATTLVVRDQQAWQTLWSQMTANQYPAPPLPVVDFTKDMVLVAAAGESTGLSVSITGASESSGGVTVNVPITRPGSNCVVPQVVLSPVDIATVAQRNGTVGFTITHKTRNCS